MKTQTVKHNRLGGFIVNGVHGVPDNPDNSDRQRIQEWVDAGGVIEAADAEPDPPTSDEIYNRTIQNSRVLRAIVVAINDGSLVPGANETPGRLKTIIKARM